MWRVQNVLNGELAAFDLSSLADGRYLLELTTNFGLQRRSTQCTFTLQSQLKTGHFSFAEEEFVAVAGGVSISYKRGYTTQNLSDTGIGHGWTNTATSLTPVLDETRVEREDLDGERFTIHGDGTRDVTVDIPGGKRTTFRYSLEPGGGHSFCYYARWTAPASAKATLAPLCSNKLMTLPGLTPYWEATGPGTPWEIFDFPGFLLTTADGTVYRFLRENLGSHEWIGEGEDDTTGFVQAWGDLYLARLERRDGTSIEFSPEAITGTAPNGTTEELVAFVRDPETGRVLVAQARGGNQTRLEYTYDHLGNLTEVRRSVQGKPLEPFRQYEYANSAFPHHLTAIRAGDRLLLSIAYDAAGRLQGTSGAGGSESRLGDAFAGVELKTDALGRQTLYRYDAAGRVQSRVEPGGAITRYEYDGAGREIAVTGPSGATQYIGYNPLGQKTSYTNEAGDTTTYAYSGDRVTAVTDALGRTSSLQYDSAGNVTRVQTKNGFAFQMSYDAAGRLKSLQGPGGSLQQHSYDPAGRLTSVADAHGVRFDYGYDSLGRNTSFSTTSFDPLTGAELTCAEYVEYDDEGREVFRSASTGDWVRTTRDTQGRVISTEDSQGGRVWVWYDAAGRVVQRSQGDGLVVRYVYDAEGQAILETLPEYTETPSEPTARMVFTQAYAQEYDDAGRLVRRRRLAGTCVLLRSMGEDFITEVVSEGTEEGGATTRYDLAGNVVSTISEEGVETRMEYDVAGRRTAVVDAAGGRMEREYGRGGLVTATTDPLGNRTAFAYNARGQLESVTAPDGTEQHLELSARGTLLAHRDELGACTYFERGLDDVLTDVELPDGTMFHYEYDAGGTLSRVVDPLGHATSFANDAWGRRVRRQLPLGQVEEWVYLGESARISSFMDADGVRTDFTYDEQLRLASQKTGPLERLYLYDSEGRTKSISLRGNGQLESQAVYDYDSKGNLANWTVDGKSFSLRHDRDGRFVSLESKALQVVGTFFPNERRVEWKVQRGPAGVSDEVWAVHRDACGRTEEVIRPDGSRCRLEYDVCGRQVAVRELGTTGEERYRWNGTYDACGQLVREDIFWRDAGHLSRGFAYDSCHRLVAEESTGTQKRWNYGQSFSYDEAGNVIGIRREDADGATEIETRTYDANDRLVGRTMEASGRVEVWSLEWSPAGNLIAEREREGACREYLWDWEGRLAGVRFLTGEVIAKQPLNRQNAARGDEERKRNLVTTQSLSDEDDVPRRDGGWDESFAITSGDKEIWRVEYNYDARGLLANATYHVNGETNHRTFTFAELSSGGIPMLLESHSSHSGETCALPPLDGISSCYTERGRVDYLRNPSGTICATIAGGRVNPVVRDAWGRPLTEDGDGPGFAGEWEDATAGLVYLRTRFYSPRLGVFLSRDDCGFDPEQPQDWNRYAYCRGDPVNRVDPMGTFSLLGVQINMQFVATMMFRYAVCRAVDVAVEIQYAAKAWSDFLEQEKEKENATVLVHGVSYHEPGYGAPMLDWLKRHVPNQDYYEFRWSGFTICGIPYMILPNYQQHRIARDSLEVCLSICECKAYRNFNIIAHSWGTVLSKDVLNDGIVPINLWATMGSPLPSPEAAFHSMPRFPTCRPAWWLNIYSDSDIVTYLAMDRPLPVVTNLWNWTLSKQSRLSQSSSPDEQYAADCHGFTAHVQYFSEVGTLGKIKTRLRRQ
ncbi:MAG: RHS repeat-associated core domain-containing protein [Victivallales bacterium]|nr:RHS repeat-associated core domain-containing protein [Victivallales bacterium]